MNLYRRCEDYRVSLDGLLEQAEMAYVKLGSNPAMYGDLLDEIDRASKLLEDGQTVGKENRKENHR